MNSIQKWRPLTICISDFSCDKMPHSAREIRAISVINRISLILMKKTSLLTVFRKMGATKTISDFSRNEMPLYFC